MRIYGLMLVWVVIGIACTPEFDASMDVVGRWSLTQSTNPDVVGLDMVFRPTGKVKITRRVVTGEGRFANPPIESFMDTVTQEPEILPWEIIDGEIIIYTDEHKFTYSKANIWERSGMKMDYGFNYRLRKLSRF